MQIKVKIDLDQSNKVLRKLIKYELRLCKSFLMHGTNEQKKFYDAYTPELAAALNTVLTHFSVPKKKK